MPTSGTSVSLAAVLLSRWSNLLGAFRLGEERLLQLSPFFGGT